MKEERHRRGMRPLKKALTLATLAAAVGTVFLFKHGRTLEGNESPLPAPAEVKTVPASITTLPRLVDLGSDRCQSCVAMIPVLEELTREYEGRLDVVFTDVWKDPDAAERYDIQLIPTQIFFDDRGKELFRHEGFISKEDILAKWKDLGYSFGG